MSDKEVKVDGGANETNASLGDPLFSITNLEVEDAINEVSKNLMVERETARTMVFSQIIEALNEKRRIPN